MLNSVAVPSDIRGVLPVLDAVLDEPDVVTADLVVVTGDHASGPQPVAVLDRLSAMGRVGGAAAPDGLPAEVQTVVGVAARGEIAMRRTVIDVDAVCAQVVSWSTFPGCQERVDYFVRATASDAEALTSFAPRDGRAPA